MYVYIYGDGMSRINYSAAQQFFTKCIFFIESRMDKGFETAKFRCIVNGHAEQTCPGGNYFVSANSFIRARLFNPIFRDPISSFS